MSAFDNLEGKYKFNFWMIFGRTDSVLCDTVRSETPAPKTETLLVVAMLLTDRVSGVYSEFAVLKNPQGSPQLQLELQSD